MAFFKNSEYRMLLTKLTSAYEERETKTKPVNSNNRISKQYTFRRSVNPRGYISATNDSDRARSHLGVAHVRCETRKLFFLMSFFFYFLQSRASDSVDVSRDRVRHPSEELLASFQPMTFGLPRKKTFPCSLFVSFQMRQIMK